MNAIGIICEYNPFHLGHARMLEGLRRQYDAPLVCAMSGNFVQRGDAAVAHKHARAEMAVRCGADLVLELPTPWAMASAERFADGGVALLDPETDLPQAQSIFPAAVCGADGMQITLQYEEA